MTGSPRGFSMKKSQGQTQARPWYRIENHVLDQNNSTSSKAVIYIYDEIGDSFWGDSTNSSDFVKELSALSVNDIELHLNTPGGDVFDGIAIYNALKSHPAYVTVIVDALAASAGSFIAQAGDKVIMTRAATMMIHDGSAFAYGNAADMRSTAELLDKISNTVADIYTARAGESIEFWRNLMVQEVWYNSSEAVAAGLADEIGGETNPADELAATNKWDLSVFNFSGRANSPSPLEVRTRIANQYSKEKRVTDTSDQTTGSPDVDPNAQTTGTPEVPAGAEPNEGTAPGENVEEPNQPGAAPTATPAGDPVVPASAGEAGGEAAPNPQNAGTLYTFNLDGKPVQMTLAQAAARMQDLQTFQNEAIVAGKKAFVKELHDSHRITGPQVDATESFALSLQGEQYEAWKATWEGASSIPMLANQIGGVTNPDGTADADADHTAGEIERCEAIVRNFKQSNMKDDAIKGTPSYQTLIALKPDFKL